MTLSDRELDARVAEKVMGWTLAKAWAPAMFVEGGWSIHTDSEHLTRHPVYVQHCHCADLQAPPDDPEKAYEQRWREEYQREVPIYGHWWQCLRVVPCFSTSIADAWTVVEKLNSGDESDWFDITIGNGLCRARFLLRGYRPFLDRTGEAEDTSPAKSICLAALRAVGEDV